MGHWSQSPHHPKTRTAHTQASGLCSRLGFGSCHHIYCMCSSYLLRGLGLVGVNAKICGSVTVDNLASSSSCFVVSSILALMRMKRPPIDCLNDRWFIGMVAAGGGMRGRRGIRAVSSRCSMVYGQCGLRTRTIRAKFTSVFDSPTNEVVQDKRRRMKSGATAQSRRETRRMLKVHIHKKGNCRRKVCVGEKEENN